MYWCYRVQPAPRTQTDLKILPKQVDKSRLLSDNESNTDKRTSRFSSYCETCRQLTVFSHERRTSQVVYRLEFCPYATRVRLFVTRRPGPTEDTHWNASLRSISISHAESTGDCVVAINTRHIALRNDAWRAEALHVARQYAKTRYDIPLFKLHEMDPTKVTRMGGEFC